MDGDVYAPKQLCNMIINPVILTGGSGSRLWPISRKNHPKPFIRLTKDHSNNSFLQTTVQRLDQIPNINDPIIVCNESHGVLVSQQLSEINRRSGTIILEPAIKNTAPALTLAALNCQDIFGDSILLTLPADHKIEQESLFAETISQALPMAKDGGIVTFGIPADIPETGYGYIGYESGDGPAYIIKEFIEKPDWKDAEAMIKSGGYLWNSGIFMMRSSIWIKQISRYEPNIFNACEEAYTKAHQNGNYLTPNQSTFLSCPSNSIDYAVMEPTSSNNDDTTESWVVPMNVGWSDLGTWKSIWEEEVKDSEGNFTHGDTFLESVTNSLVISDHKTIAVTNANNLAIIESDDAILVSSLDGVSEIKNLIESLEESEPELLLKLNYEEKPWGCFRILTRGIGFQIKLLTVNATSSLSLQNHKYRAEHWIVLKGAAEVTIGDKQSHLLQNDSVFIPAGEKHRLENKTDHALEIIEVQTGTYFGEDDITRYKDTYGRV